MTVVLIALNVALFLAAMVWAAGGGLPYVLAHMGANLGLQVAIAEPWRVLSCAFLHFSIVHLAANMWALWVVGSTLETLIGPPRFVVLYGLCALAGGAVSTVLLGPREVGAGASGAVWGLMGAELALVLKPPPAIVVRPGAVKSVLQVLGVNLLISLMPGIDLAAHLGGGVMGALLVLTRGVTGRLAGRPEDPGLGAWKLAAAATCVLMGASIALALGHGRPWALP